MKLFFHIVFLIIFLTLTLKSEEKINLTVDENLITINNTDVYANCCSAFLSDFSITNNVITITQRDTSSSKCKCMCNYDLNYNISQIPPGNYTLIINREENTKFGYSENKKFNIYKSKFIVETQQSKSPLSFDFKQTPCSKSTTNIAVNPPKNGVEVFPNPSSSLIYLRYEMKKAGDATIRIINFLGKEIAVLKRPNLNEGIQTIYLDMSDIPSGFYVGKISTSFGQSNSFKIAWSK